jgi:hypothetical protein
VGCCWRASAGWGHGRVPEKVVIVDWGSRAVPGRRVEGGEVKHWQGLGLPSPPRVQTVDDKRKDLQKTLDSKRRSPAGLSPSLVGLLEKKGEKGKKTSLGSLCLNTNSNSNLFEKILKTFRK